MQTLVEQLADTLTIKLTEKFKETVRAAVIEAFTANSAAPSQATPVQAAPARPVLPSALVRQAPRPARPPRPVLTAEERIQRDERILAALASGPKTIGEIHEATGFDLRGIAPTMRYMIRQGQVSKQGKDRFKLKGAA